MEIEEFWDEVLSWGDEISYPKKLDNCNEMVMRE